MRIRTRITVVLAASLSSAGAMSLLVNQLAMRNTTYPTMEALLDAILDELGIAREVIIRHLRHSPEHLFGMPGDLVPGFSDRTIDQAARVVQQRRLDEALARSRRWSVVGVLVIVLGALAIGWALAGRILRPVRSITTRARTASANDIGTRVGLQGPHDEMKDLADTIDAMLDRMALAFDAQRRFSAQVCHELRTPLATTRTHVEMLLADTDDAELHARLEAVAGAIGRADRLVAQLLVLARTDTRDLDRERFELDELVGNVVGRAVEGAQWPGLRVELELKVTPVVGDRSLVESMVRNLIDNAGRHNGGDGWVTIGVGPSPNGEGALLEVSNTTAEPAHDGRSTRPPGNPHTGLSIVTAVLDAHGGTIAWRHEGTVLTALVELPVASAPSELAVAGGATRAPAS